MSKEIIKDNNQTDTRADKLKLFSIGSVVLLAAIILLVNFLFDKVLGKPLTFDFSDSFNNTISAETQQYLDSLPADTNIKIVGLFNRPDNVASTEYQYIIPLLDDYVKKSGGKITLEYIDPTEQPTIINTLDPTNSYDLGNKAGCFVVSYNGRIKVIEPIDCYSYDLNTYYQTGYYYIDGNNTEFTFTNTMYNLTSGNICNAYIVTGLKEAGSVNLTKVLEAMSIEVTEIPASDNFTIPEDCDLLIINGANNDISERMYVVMSDYLKNGGKMFVAVDYSSANVNERFDRLNKLLNQMNINIDPLLIYENDPGYQHSGVAIDSTVVATGDFANYASIPYLSCTYARSVTSVDSTISGYTASPVLQTSENASTHEVAENGTILEDSGSVNKYNVAMYSTGATEDSAEVFVFGTLNFTSDSFMNSYGLNHENVDFFRSCVNELLGGKIGNHLNIATKNVDNYSLDTTKSTTSVSTAMLVVFMIVIPVILIALAVVVYSKRKNL